MSAHVGLAGSLRPITDGELRRIVQLVYDGSGISLHEGKRELVEARLQKRMRSLELVSFGEYLSLIENDASGEELRRLLDAVATNFTSFLREPAHFDFLRDHILPEVADSEGAAPAIWCAASSTGEEPVSIAMTLRDFGVTDYSIVASDISTKALGVARRGIYPLAALRNVPLAQLRRHFERGRGPHEGFARAKRELRAHIDYRRINLVAAPDLGRRFPVIFCRNVMIYFDRPTQQRVVAMLERHLPPGGYLFISHSESLNGLTHGLRWVAPAIYRKVTS